MWHKEGLDICPGPTAAPLADGHLAALQPPVVQAGPQFSLAHFGKVEIICRSDFLKKLNCFWSTDHVVLSVMAANSRTFPWSWVGTITFLSSAILCLNFDIFQVSSSTCSLARLVLPNLIHYKTFPAFLLCFWDSVSPRENYHQIYDYLEETRTRPLGWANLSQQLLRLGMEQQSSVPKFC